MTIPLDVAVVEVIVALVFVLVMHSLLMQNSGETFWKLMLV